MMRLYAKAINESNVARSMPDTSSGAGMVAAASVFTATWSVRKSKNRNSAHIAQRKSKNLTADTLKQKQKKTFFRRPGFVSLTTALVRMADRLADYAVSSSGVSIEDIWKCNVLPTERYSK